MTAMAEQQRINFALEQVEMIYPGIREHFDGVTKCWDDDEWARGASAYYKPGQFSSLLPHVSRPEGRIHFAGEHTSVWIDGWMQGALESGNRRRARSEFGVMKTSITYCGSFRTRRACTFLSTGSV
jgi:monoamine oxidase